MPFDTYIQFVHLIDEHDNQLVAQSDRQLGQIIYPADAWQPGEVIVDRVILDLPAGNATDRYQLRAGVYQYPSLQRLRVPGTADNSVLLGPITVTP
jgi:sortase (surface protein transpeptidase)